MKKKKLSSVVLAQKKKNIAKKKTKNLALKLTTYCILWAGLLFTLLFSVQIERFLNVTNFIFESKITSGDYRVHFIDVGQGDCILVELPDDKTVVIDSGPSSSKNNLLKYFNALDITIIDYFILTHTDSDHIGNAVTIFENFNVLNVYIPKLYSNYDVEKGYDVEDYKVVTTDVWSRVTQAIYNESCLENLKYNFNEERFFTDEYSFVFYSPFQDIISVVNDYSPIIMLNVQGFKYIFTGDATSNAEGSFLENYSVMVENNFFDCDVLKVGHHGSASSSSTAFLEATQAEIAVISVGANNSYSHPKDEILDNLFNAGCEIMRTDIMGSIVMTSSNGEIVSQTDYNFIGDVYVEWNSFVVGGGVILMCSAFVFLKKSSKKM